MTKHTTPSHDKATAAAFAAVRDLAQLMPNKGERYRMLNAIDRLSSIVKRAGTVKAIPAAQIAAQAKTRTEIFRALMRGRHLSLYNSKEFRASQFHTDIVKIRQHIDRHALPWVMVSKWVRDDSTGRRCKEYWLEQLNEQDINNFKNFQ